MSDELLGGISRTYSKIRGEQTGLTEDVSPESATTSTQATDTMSADELLRIARDIKDQRAQSWLEDYDRYIRESMLREIEEMSKPLYNTPYMRYLAWHSQTVIPPVRLLPYIAEGTPAKKRIHTQSAKRERRQHRAAFRRRKRGLA